MKYCFFGSSVTEQATLYKTGEVVGYVNHFITNYLNEDSGSALRIARGNTDICNAGIIYLDDIIKWKPDICILDWATSGNPEADIVTIYHIYKKLLAHNILPFTVIFPRKKRCYLSLPVYKKQVEICQYFGTPLLEIDPETELDNILRDTVHTNVLGGKIYAEKVYAGIKKILPIQPINIEENHPFTDHFISSSELFLNDIPTKILNFEMEVNTQNTITIQIFAEQMVGPYTPIIDISIFDLKGNLKQQVSENMLDIWCYRERMALKALTSKISVDKNTSKIIGKVSYKTPEHSIFSKEILEGLSKKEQYLKGIKRTFVIFQSIEKVTSPITNFKIL